MGKRVSFCCVSPGLVPNLKCPSNELCVLGRGHVASLLVSDLRRSLFNACGCCDHPDLIVRMRFPRHPPNINLNNGPSSHEEGKSRELAHLFGEAAHSEFLIRCLLLAFACHHLHIMPQCLGPLMIYNACYFWFKSDSSLATDAGLGVD